MNTYSKGLKQLIEAEGKARLCCVVNNNAKKCEFYSVDSGFDCRVFNFCIEKYEANYEALGYPANAKIIFERVLNQMLNELITE